jgi:hypothetical protein
MPDEIRTVFAVVGGLAFLVAAGLAAWRVWMLIGWKKAPATVVTVTQSNVRGRYLTVRVTTDGGEVVEAVDESIMGTYWPDQVITVRLVPRSDPPRVVVPEFLRFWLASLILAAVGTPFLCVAWMR